jgi:3-hydroxypropanoate dehydrogenase
MMDTVLPQAALDQLFLEARTHNAWLDKPVGEDSLRALYHLARMAPTSANCSPARIVFLRSVAAKERLRPALSAGNVEKAMCAPVTAIIAYDLRFYEMLPLLFPHKDVRPQFIEDERHAQVTAFRNSTLQGAYFMLAARAVGLDCGPLSGFDQLMVDREFFGGGSVRSNFLCNLGYGDASVLFPRLPRLAFDQACTLL